jgi:hypothetical protein
MLNETLFSYANNSLGYGEYTSGISCVVYFMNFERRRIYFKNLINILEEEC